MSASDANSARRSGWGSKGVLIAGGLIVAMLLASWASQLLSRMPSIALLVNPYNAAALVIRAEAALDRSPPDLEEARRYAYAALRADPLAPGTHRTLSRIAVQAKENEATARYTQLAARFARDGDSQLMALQRAAAAGDYPEIAHRLDMLFRGQSTSIWVRISQVFGNAIAAPAFATALAAKLGENPPWRRVFLEQAFTHVASVDALIGFFNQLAAPSDAETRLFLERLVRDQRYEAAHALFMRMVPADRREETKLLYNSRFQHGVSNIPFDWVITRMPNTLIDVRRDGDRRTLRVAFFGGRTAFRNVNHLMALAPGSYVFSGVEQALSFDNPRGMRWRIFCTNAPDENIATTALLTGDIQQRPFNVPFTVPSNCPYQNLQLELAYRVALEQEATGSVAYSEMSVAVAPQ